MALKEEWERSGGWLFRWRSYPPLFLVALVLIVAILPLRIAVSSGLSEEVWELFCLLVGLTGVVLRAHVVGHAAPNTSGRNTQTQEADVVNTSGWYSVVRHPLYVGNLLMWLGPMMVMRSPWATLITLLAFWLYYERIMFAEEEFLRRRFGPVFEEWAAKTPAFIPRLTGWVRPAVPFSFRYVLRREYSGWFGLAVAFAFADWVDDFARSRVVQPDPMSLSVVIAGAILYLGLRTLKKHSDVLQVDGR